MAVHRRRALVVDDDAGVREVIADALRLEDVEVSTARGAADAIAALEGGCKPGVILLDLQMPGVSGERLLPRFREHPASRAVPIIAMSASPDRLARIEGPDALLPKPFDLDTLLELVGRLCGPAERDALTSGIGPIDAEHQEQLELAQAFAETLRVGEGGERATRLLEQLTTCTRNHFSSEAGLMLSHGYPGAADHLREHARCVDELERWRAAAASTSFTVEAAAALGRAIEVHIATMDHDFVSYLSSEGAGA